MFTHKKTSKNILYCIWHWVLSPLGNSDHIPLEIKYAELGKLFNEFGWKDLFSKEMRCLPNFVRYMKIQQNVYQDKAIELESRIGSK